jgi:hypothetical protein
VLFKVMRFDRIVADPTHQEAAVRRVGWMFIGNVRELNGEIIVRGRLSKDVRDAIQ